MNYGAGRLMTMGGLADTFLVVDGWRLGHRPGLDQLRGVAVLMVLFGHTILDGGAFDYIGAAGVAVFFTLSGFLITRLLIEEREVTARTDLRAFYVRRARRLLPALPVALLLCALVNAAHGLPWAMPATSSAFYVANFAKIVDPGAMGAFGHLWSLAIEEHFYLLWPILFARLSAVRLIQTCVAVVAVVAVARSVIAVDHPTWAYGATFLRIDGLLVGCLLALHRRWKPPRTLVVASVGVVVMFCSASAVPSFNAWGATVMAGAAAVLVADRVDSGFRLPVLERVGIISYGLYLFHYPVALFLRSYVSGWTLTVATFVMTFALAEMSFRWVESPWRARSGVVLHDRRLVQ